jgi:hypothetical protein
MQLVLAVNLERRDLQPDKGRPGVMARRYPLAAADAREELGYRDLRERIADGVTVRQFAEFYSDPMVKHNAAIALQSAEPQTSEQSVIWRVWSHTWLAACELRAVRLGARYYFRGRSFTHRLSRSVDLRSRLRPVVRTPSSNDRHKISAQFRIWNT